MTDVEMVCLQVVRRCFASGEEHIEMVFCE